ncbi:right-handed parallel beta-helix repeat-containing protein [Puniceicoccaceae bacterium K14]|nr:right-handed parallel beta-helix repeat-containing protein [Puniceicoccaceae bacterium K14]
MITLLTRTFFTLSLASLLLATSVRSQTDMYFFDPDLDSSTDITSFTDVIVLPSFEAQLLFETNIPSSIESGSITITLPEGFSYADRYDLRLGDLKTIESANNTITITLEKDAIPDGSRVKIWLFLSIPSYDDLPPSATQLNIFAQGDLLGFDGETYNVDHTFQTAVVYSKGTVTTDKDGDTLAGGEEMTIFVDVEPFPLYDIYYSRIAVNIPFLTDLVPGSITGLQGGFEKFQGQVYAEYPSGGISGFSFSFKVKAVEQELLDLYVADGFFDGFELNEPSTQLRVRTPFTLNDNDPSGEFHRRIFGTQFGEMPIIPLPDPDTVTMVNSTGDRPRDPNADDCSTGFTIENGDPECTLRSAIEAVNAGIIERIEFDIPGNDVPSIALQSALPAITVPVVIDGTTQSAGRVEVRGNGMEDTIGLEIKGGKSEVKGLVIHGFDGEESSAIQISGPGENIISGNWIGVDLDGNAASNNQVGVIINGSSKNTIGGGAASDANIIYGSFAGVQIEGANANENKVISNRIGMASNGKAFSPLPGQGVIVSSGNTNQIGGPGSQFNYIIAETGVTVIPEENSGEISNLEITGNRIGLDSTGKEANECSIGIIILGFSTTPVSNAKIISNKIGGISLTSLMVAAVDNGVTGLLVQGNDVGLSFDGSGTLPSGLGEGGQLYGIRLDAVSDATINNNNIAGHVWNVLVSGIQNLFVTEPDPENNDEGGRLVLRIPSEVDEVLDGETPSSGVEIDGNRIGLNNSNVVPEGSTQTIGILSYGFAEETKITNNTIAGHLEYEIQLEGNKKSSLSSNRIGTVTGNDYGSQIGVFVDNSEETEVGPNNIISKNEISGVQVTGPSDKTRIYDNIIGTDQGGGLSWPNGSGITLVDGGNGDAAENTVIENNIIAYNSQFGVAINSQFGYAKIISNLIYRNEQGLGPRGIAYNTPQVTLPDDFAVFETEADDEDMISVSFFVSPTGSLVEEGEEEPKTILEIFGNPSANETQGRTLLLSETIDPTKTFFKTFEVSSNSVYATSQNYTLTYTRGIATSEFSGPTTSMPIEIPEMQVDASDSDEIIISWESPEFPGLFTVEETRTLDNGNQWTVRPEEVEESDGRTFVTLPLAGEEQFFRITLNPDALGSEE